MDLLTYLAYAGGLLFLLNKIFLWFSVRTTNKNREYWLLVVAWSIYLLGVPPWVIYFVQNNNWMAGAMEAGGIPIMVLGLMNVIRERIQEKAPAPLRILANISILVGFLYSLYDFGGITVLNQWLELFLTIGFLVGTYQLADKKRSGYIWYIVMHIACALLVFQQGATFLFGCQIASLIFVADAWRVAGKRKNHSEKQHQAHDH